MKNWLAGTWAVVRKDLQIEFRNRYAVNTLLLFAVGALLLVTFALGPQAVPPRVQSAILWIVLLFAASIGLGRSFVAEYEAGTHFLLHLNVRGSMVFAGKLVFNLALVLILTVVSSALFVMLLDVSIGAPALFVTTIGLGALGVTGATTLLAAVIARASRSGPLLPVLLLPVLVPVLVSGAAATRKAIVGQAWITAQDELLTLIGFAGATISAAVVLFDFVWEE